MEATHSNSRIICPVATCPEESSTSSRHFRDFASIKNHLNDHCTGHLSGAVPPDFLRYHSYSQCIICDRILHTRYHGVCLRCRPAARAREQVNALREPASSPTRNPTSSHPQSAQGLTARPSLAAIHGKYVPTIRNIPLAVRRLWDQCLKQSLAQVVWSNSEVSWVELQMLAKCTLCRPARGGKRHKSQRLA